MSMKRPTKTDSDAVSAAGMSVDPRSVEGLFLLAMQKKDPAEREAHLAEVCGGDEEVRKRVTALLQAYDDAGSFLETPVGDQRPGQDMSLGFLVPTEKDGCLGTIGLYEVLDVIGCGGMGIVLRAFDPKLNRVVAIKVLKPELAMNANARRRFLREARAAAAVSHPHVVTIHSVEEAALMDANVQKSTPPYLVMECVIGHSLQQRVDLTGSLRLEESLRISRQIAAGLAAAHSQGLIHRDIKPANILLENGVERVKITDFGLARAIDDVSVTRTGELSGTPQYMSPEQAAGERVDHRSDLFSLGCVMYAMCTGHSPFRADSLVRVIKRVTLDAPRSIVEQNPEVPDWLVEIISCLLQKDPDQRFQTAQELVEILDRHLARIQQPETSESHSRINQQATAVVALRTESSSPSREGQMPKPTPTAAHNGCAKEPAARLPSDNTTIAVSGESIHGKVGRYLLLCGLFVVVLPPMLIAAGAIVVDGDLMELGGSLMLAACPSGLVAIALGYVLRYIVDSAVTRQRRLRLYVPILLAMLAAAFGAAYQWTVERERDDPVLPRPDRSAIVAPVPDRPRVTLEHPELDVRKVMVNGLGSTIQTAPQATTLFLRPELLGTRINIHLFAVDGREYLRFAFPLERLKDTIRIMDADLAPGNRVLVTVIDDVPDFELRLVCFPNQKIGVNKFCLAESPFHKLLPPGEHPLELTYIRRDAQSSSKPEDYERLTYTVTVTGTEPVKLSLKELIEQGAKHDSENVQGD